MDNKDDRTKNDQKLYQWTTLYPDGTQGAISALVPFVGHIPLYTRDPKVVELMRPVAMKHALDTGQKCWLRTWHTYSDEQSLQVTKESYNDHLIKVTDQMVADIDQAIEEIIGEELGQPKQ